MPPQAEHHHVSPAGASQQRMMAVGSSEAARFAFMLVGRHASGHDTAFRRALLHRTLSPLRSAQATLTVMPDGFDKTATRVDSLRCAGFALSAPA